jgi:hypothetical protein
MPGKLGPRPADFDEVKVRESPTFQNWMALQPGQVLRYACRDFVRGYQDDEEKLMRRIMIARRNNLKDHAMLKRARGNNDNDASEEEVGAEGGLLCHRSAGGVYGSGNSNSGSDINELPPLLPPSRRPKRQREQRRQPQANEEDDNERSPSGGYKKKTKRNRAATTTQQRINRSDDDIIHEMDMEAVEATRSYRKWSALPNDATFVYNQTYTKGKDGDDWLLKKNIWRRMRYRRQNRDKVDELKHQVEGGERVRSSSRRMKETEGIDSSSSTVHTHDRNGTVDVGNDVVSRAVRDAVRDAAAVASQLELGLMQGSVHSFHPASVGIDVVAVAALNDPMVVSALDAAAQLAASAVAEAEAPALFGQSASV